MPHGELQEISQQRLSFRENHHPEVSFAGKQRVCKIITFGKIWSYADLTSSFLRSNGWATTELRNFFQELYFGLIILANHNQIPVIGPHVKDEA